MAAPRFWLASSSKRPRCKADVTSFVAARAGHASRQRAAQRRVAERGIALGGLIETRVCLEKTDTEIRWCISQLVWFSKSSGHRCLRELWRRRWLSKDSMKSKMAWVFIASTG